MKLIALAACFLFFCQPAPARRGHLHGCDMVKGFDSWANQDDFVSGFPLAQQHRVLVCLEKLKSGELR